MDYSQSIYIYIQLIKGAVSVPNNLNFWDHYPVFAHKDKLPYNLSFVSIFTVLSSLYLHSASLLVVLVCLISGIAHVTWPAPAAAQMELSLYF